MWAKNQETSCEQNPSGETGKIHERLLEASWQAAKTDPRRILRHWKDTQTPGKWFRGGRMVRQREAASTFTTIDATCTK